MFDSDLLDMLSRVHPAVPVVIYVPAIALLVGFALVTGGVSRIGGAGLFAGGVGFLPPGAAARDHPRRAPRPPERPAAARDATVRERPAVVPVPGRLLGAARHAAL